MIIVENHTSFLQQVSRGYVRRCNPLLQKFTTHRHLNYFRDKVHINGGDDSPSVALRRLGCYLYGGLSNSTKRVINNIFSVNHVNRIMDTDELKTFFYGNVIGVKPTTLCVCSDNQMSESSFIKHVRTTNKINEEDGGFAFRCPGNQDFQGKYQITPIWQRYRWLEEKDRFLEMES